MRSTTERMIAVPSSSTTRQELDRESIQAGPAIMTPSEPRSVGRRGAFILSLDTELAWGSVPSGQVHERSWMFGATREVARALLDLLAAFEIHATWAVVGHLMLDHCRARGRVKHPELVRPRFPWFEGDWLADDPCTDARAEPYWYAPDLVESILKCPTSQEIGSHGFAHIPAGESGCSRECFESDLEAAIHAARAWGLELRSYVYPWDSVGHVDVLARHGFVAYRGTLSEPDWVENSPDWVKRSRRALRCSLPIAPLTAVPTPSHGVWNLPATTFYYHRGKAGRLLPMAARVHRAKRGIREATMLGTVFHLYFHPFNLATDPDGLLGGLESIFEFVALERAAGRLQNPTMSEYGRSLGPVPGRSRVRETRPGS